MNREQIEFYWNYYNLGKPKFIKYKSASTFKRAFTVIDKLIQDEQE